MKLDRVSLLACLLCACAAGCSDGSASDDKEEVILCGNGLLDEGEACDDSNRADGDGCSSACEVEDGWECLTEGEPCTKKQVIPDEPLPECGDGIANGNEECDDGNLADGDGCSSECKVEKGYECIGSDCKEIAPGELCGNGAVDEGEACDDGNQESGDGCMSNCLVIEKDYECPIYGGKCALPGESVCGDGEVTGGEECDDGNAEPGDGCSESCAVERGWHCEVGAACSPVCGDYIIAGDEECDDGGTFNGDGCSSLCKFEPGFNCRIEGEFTVCEPLGCGDGIVSPELGEECDVPEELGAEYGWSKERKEPYCTSLTIDNATGNKISGCTYTPYCGDGIVQAEFGEECDLKMVDAEGNAVGGDGSYNGCLPNCRFAGACGNGELDPGEACDDNNTNDGDGCSADCMKVEEGWVCAGTACTRLSCGNGEHDAGEQCDDGNFAEGDGCYHCRAEEGYMCQYTDPACPEALCKNQGKECEKITVLYGDGMITEGFEDCDDGNTVDNDGCTKGVIDAGYVCPTPGKPCIAAACGDGILATGEQCDDGNTDGNDGCSGRCKLELGYSCPTAGAPCVMGYCGDGIVQAGEECDNDVVAAGTVPLDGDGCSSQCIIEEGYKCLKAGGACVEDACGEGKINHDPLYSSFKECDLGASQNGAEGSGCSNICKIEDGYHCDENGQNCVKGSCGDGILDAGEECDDGNLFGGDGCDPACKREPIFECDGNACTPVCGDGVTMWMAGEECDDGNLINGDGCSSSCKIEKGFTCTDFSKAELPETIDIPVTYRDFRYGTATNAAGGDGYMSQAFVSEINESDICKTGAKNKMTVNYGFSDFQRYGDGGAKGCRGMVENELDADGKPVFVKSHNGKPWTVSEWQGANCLKDDGTADPSDKYYNHITCPKSFYYWYRDVENVNRAVDYTLKLELTDKENGIYSFNSGAPGMATGVTGKLLSEGGNTQFCPLNCAGYYEGDPATCKETNHGGFTSELHTYFQYRGGESLRFVGDDDVWVFVNGKLFVDVGGMQATAERTGTLGKEEYTAGVDSEGADIKLHKDSKLGLYENGIYDIKMFHAERMMGSSNFHLQLSGFLNVGKAECASTCGDGIVAGVEQCDIKDHVNDEYANFKGCINCKKVNVCGNGTIEPGEACDTGHLCKDVSSEICQEMKVTYVEDPACDPVTCTYATCNDGELQDYEECDCKDGNCQISNKFDPASKCLDTCKVAKCGDGMVTAEIGEECDNGEANGDNAECTKQCTLAVCGDGIVQAFLGEVCDLGKDANGISLNTGAYGKNGQPGCSMDCRFKTPYCGDGKLQKSEGEQCDDGANNNDNLYNGCTTKCELGPRCGDGKVQESEGEQCDDGENNGTESCSKTCQKIVN